ncbi:hypothetical protein [Streptomyces sp. KHY 26]
MLSFWIVVLPPSARQIAEAVMNFRPSLSRRYVSRSIVRLLS